MEPANRVNYPLSLTLGQLLDSIGPQVGLLEAPPFEWGLFETEIFYYQSDASRYKDIRRDCTFEWEYFLSTKAKITPNILAHIYYLRVMAEGAVTWTKLLAFSMAVQDVAAAIIHLQAIRLILDHPRLPRASSAIVEAFLFCFEKFKIVTKEQVIEAENNSSSHLNEEVKVHNFGWLLDEKEGNIIYRRINFATLGLDDSRKLLYLILKMAPEFWDDKWDQIAALVKKSTQKKDNKISRLDKVLLDIEILTCFIYGVGKLTKFIDTLKKDEELVFSAFLHLAYVERNTIPLEFLLELIGMAVIPTDLNVIARMIHHRQKSWSSEDFNRIMNQAVLKDHLLLQLSEEVMTRFYEDDRFQCFRERNVEKIIELVDKTKLTLMEKKLEDNVKVLRDFAVLMRYLDVYSEGHPPLRESYLGFCDHLFASQIAFHMWNLNYENRDERAVSDALMRRYQKITDPKKFQEFQLKAISIKNNFMGETLFETRLLGLLSIIREVENGLEWHIGHKDSVKKVFGNEFFFDCIDRVGLRSHALLIYHTCLHDDPKFKGWLPKFIDSIANGSEASFHAEPSTRLEIMMHALSKLEDWNIGDVNGIGTVNECLIALLEAVVKTPTVIAQSSSDQLLEWIDCILKCKEGSEELWHRTVELLKQIDSLIKASPKKSAPKARGKGKGKGQNKAVDPFHMRWELLKSHVKKVVNSDEHMHEMIRALRAASHDHLDKMKSQNLSYFSHELETLSHSSEKLETKQTDDDIRKNYFDAKKLLLRNLLGELEKSRHAAEGVFEETETEMEKHLQTVPIDKKGEIFGKKLGQWNKGILNSMENRVVQIQENAKKNIDRYAQAVAQAKKQRDFDLKKRSLLTKETTGLGTERYLEVIQAQQKALEALSVKRAEKISAAVSDDEIERIEQTFERKAAEIRDWLHKRVSRVAQQKIPVDPDQSLVKQMKALDRENEALRRDLSRAESHANELQQAALKQKANEIVDGRSDLEKLVTLLDGINSTAIDARKMIKMVQKEGAILTSVAELVLFLEHAGFTREDLNGGSHRTFKGPHGVSVTIANHGDESKPEEIAKVVEAVLTSLKRVLAV